MLFAVCCLLCAVCCVLAGDSTEAAVSSQKDKQLETASVNQGGSVATSANFRQQTSVGDAMGSGRVSSSNFRLTPGFVGAALSGTTSKALSPLDIQTLYAKTEPVGVSIAAKAWQRDHDPIFYWEAPPHATGIAGYSYEIDGVPDNTIETTDTSFNVATSALGPLSDGVHTFSVKAINAAGSTGNPISFELWVDATPPVIGEVAPQAGTLLKLAAPTIQAAISDERSGVNSQTVELLIDEHAATAQFNAATGVMTAQPATLSDGTHVLKLRAADAAGNVQSWLLWSITTDTVAPTGTVVLNGGAEETASSYVTLSLAAADATSGVNRILISNDPTGSYVEEPYIVLRQLWLLTPVRGLRTVYVKFADAAGNVSEPVSDQIYLNLRAPETLITSGPAGFVPEQAATFTFMCPEGTCLFSYAFDGEAWSPWGTSTAAVASELTFGNHVFRVKAAQDVNGMPGIQPDEEDPTPAERTWGVGTPPSLLTIPRGSPIKIWRLE